MGAFVHGLSGTVINPDNITVWLGGQALQYRVYCRHRIVTFQIESVLAQKISYLSGVKRLISVARQRLLHCCRDSKIVLRERFGEGDARRLEFRIPSIEGFKQLYRILDGIQFPVNFAPLIQKLFEFSPCTIERIHV